MNTEKAVVIIGPTASGKSDLALKIALDRNGEIISVDSRQIYRGLDMGTGKVSKEERALVPHHLIDVCEPGTEYNVSDFLKDAERIENDIRSRNKLPIFCGGSLFWMESYMKKSAFPSVPPNQKLRALLEKKSAEELFQELAERDSERAKTIDTKNKVRLIRALEIIASLGKVPSLESDTHWQGKYETHIINLPREVLRERIKNRLSERFQNGMIEEVEKLLVRGISHDWLEKIGLEYRYISWYLQKKLTKHELEHQLFHAIWHYATRQITFLKKFI